MGIRAASSSKETSEQSKKLKKMRSVKVANLDRLRLSIKRKRFALSQQVIFPDDGSSQTSKQGPNYMKPTTCSNAKRGSLQPKPGDDSIEMKSVRGVVRLHSLKRSKKMCRAKSRSKHENPSSNLTGSSGLHLSVNDDEFEDSIERPPHESLRDQVMVRSRSIRPARVKSVRFSGKKWSKSRIDRASISVMPDDEGQSEIVMPDSRTEHMEGASSCNARQKSENYSLDVPGVTPARTLWKTRSQRSRRALIKTRSKRSELGRTSLDRATCSSTIKRSKAPQSDHSPSAYGSESHSISHVCTYTYCSCHRHTHVSSPPLKGFILTKRCSFKKQKSMKGKHKPKTKATSSSSGAKKLQLQKVSKKAESASAHTDFSENSAGNSPIQTDSVATNILFDKGKYGNLWNLLYANVLLPRNELPDAVGEKERDEGPNKMDVDCFSHNQNHDADMVNQEAAGEKPAFNQNEAIEFVQQAVDEILHFDKHSSSDEPIIPKMALKDDGAESHAKGEECARELQGHNTIEQEKEDSSSTVKLPQRQRSKGFQRLRKVIATNKFIKSMEKLRKLTTERVPAHLRSEAHSETERSPLRHLSMVKRKGTEEWMLDCALQQVIGKLEADQQTRVSILIEAFERLTPDTNIHGYAAMVSPAKHSASKMIMLNGVEVDQAVSSVEGEDQVDFERTQSELEIVSEVDDHAHESSVQICSKQIVLGSPTENSQVGEPKARDFVGISQQGISGKNVVTAARSNENPKQVNDDFVTHVNKKHKVNTENSCIAAKFLNFGSSKSTEECCESSKMVKDPLLQTSGDSEVKSNAVQDANLSFDKEKFTSVWHQVYQRFIASEAIGAGNKKNDGADEKEQCEDMYETKKHELNKADAVQLVQEAVVELLHLHEQLSDQKPSEASKIPACDESHNDEEKLKGIHVSRDPFRRQPSKAYSKLRKMVVSAKFIKAMEKIGKINRCKPRNHSTLPEDVEAERVLLRRSSMEDRKKTEEWMIDCALQEVITKLAPAQQRNVVILTQAFETFSQELEQVSPQCFNEVLQPRDEENKEEMSNTMVREYTNVGGGSLQDPDDEVCNLLEIASKSSAQKEEEKKEVDQELDTQLYNDNYELSGVNLHIHSQGSKKGCPVCYPPDISEDREEKVLTTEHQMYKVEALADESERDYILSENDQDNGEYFKISPDKQITAIPKVIATGKPGAEVNIIPADISVQEPFKSLDFKDDTNPDGEKYASMWHLIYKRMKKDDHETPEKTASSNFHQICYESSQEDSDPKNTELQQKIAVKLVQEAVDEILLMQEQTCDNQQITPGDTQQNFGPAEEKTDKAEERTDKELPRNSSMLSKVILCKKFIKTMGKMKKNNPKGQRHLPQRPDSTYGGTHLNLGSKNDDEWMLDYALQQVIEKLAPAQKRKVSSLVEAFEKFNPLPGEGEPIRDLMQ